MGLRGLVDQCLICQPKSTPVEVIPPLVTKLKVSHLLSTSICKSLGYITILYTLFLTSNAFFHLNFSDAYFLNSLLNAYRNHFTATILIFSQCLGLFMSYLYHLFFIIIFIFIIINHTILLKRTDLFSGILFITCLIILFSVKTWMKKAISFQTVKIHPQWE